ncbi:MAG: 6-phospho-3-hexuloisomerase [Candidatus Altiarchaeota archaeon]
MPVKTAMLKIAEHINDAVKEIDDGEVDLMVEEIQKAKKIFLVGAGRSGLVAKAFAMRLVQLGLTAYVVGETTSPAITKKDLLIAVSGSGKTTNVVNVTKIAKDIGAKALTITSYPNADLGQLSDHVVKIKGRTKIDIEKDYTESQLKGHFSSLTPLGTLFEDTVMIFFDGVIARLMSELGKGESYMKKRHATLEWFY